MKKVQNKLLCILLSVVLLVSILPITVYADTVVYYVSNSSEMQNAATAINAAGAGEYVIELTADITTGTAGISFDKTGAVVTIIGNGHTYYCPRGMNVEAWNGATLNLGDGKSALILKGGENNDDPGVVYVNNGSVCNMYDKVTIKDHKGQNYFAGGVTVQASTFHMYGGTIQNCGIDGGSICFGGGVAVFEGGTFIMDDGVIDQCYATSDYIDDYDPSHSVVGLGGGVFVTGGSTFTMNGGTISNCEATNFGGGVAMLSSDSYSNSEWKNYGMGNPKSNVTINGGTISGNTADNGAGVFVSGYHYAFAGPFGWISTGVTDSPGLYINGGKITENEAEGDGGGVLIMMVRPAAAVQIHNAEITGNTAYRGAGIESYGYWTQLDIDGCTISENTAETNGGGILLSSNSSGGYTNLKNTTITDNTSGARGAGVYYDANSKLNISGADIIQDNTYNGTLNNLNVLSLSKPVYVTGDLTGSQIGLSDPTLWDDGLEDYDPEAVSTNYLTSGYKTYNSADPDTVFTSDHESWYADFSDVNENEVRLFLNLNIDYHINNDAISTESYHNDDIFTQYVDTLAHTVKVGDTIEAFYPIPVHDSSYIFKGWYYDPDNDDDDNPVKFGTDKYIGGKDIYAHWIKIENVAQDEDDPYTLPAGETEYVGYDLTGVQIRDEMLDYNFDEITPGGMRFITALSMDVVNEINAIKPNNIEYGYVAATNEDWINYHRGHENLQYVSETANGINTTATTENDEDYFGFAKNINCTSKRANSKNGVVNQDHHNYSDYLLYTLVITYNNGEGYDKDVLARPYIRYSDANGLERVAYSDYRGTNVLGGCYTNYDAVKNMASSNH